MVTPAFHEHDYPFLPKSAGTSPHRFVSHFSIGTRKEWVLSHISARAITLYSWAVCGVRSSFVLHCRFCTHRMALRLSEYIVFLMPCFSMRARACTMARNSPMLFVPCTGPKWNTSTPVARSMPRYSIGPGLPEQAASTAHACASTSIGRGSTVSFL